MTCSRYWGSCRWRQWGSQGCWACEFGVASKWWGAWTAEGNRRRSLEVGGKFQLCRCLHAHHHSFAFVSQFYDDVFLVLKGHLEKLNWVQHVGRCLLNDRQLIGTERKLVSSEMVGSLSQ